MASTFPDSYNPFEAPTAALSPTLAGPVGTDVEQIRQRYLKHEASVRSIGTLSYLGAFFCGLGTVGYLIGAVAMSMAPARAPQATLPFPPALLFGAGAVVFLIFGGVYGAMGYGLRRLQTWARWVMIVLCTLSLIYVLGIVGVALVADPTTGGVMAGLQTIPAAFTAYILYLMASAKGSVVFSPGYREVVRQTPHIRYKTSLLIKILLGLLVGLIILGVLGAIIGSVNGR